MLQLSSGIDRYWVLLTYTLMAAMQGMTWAVPGSILNTYTSPAVYNVSVDTAQLFLNYGPIFYLLCAFPVMWHMDRYGIRGTVWSGILLVASSNVIRCFANDSSTRSVIFLHLSFILNASAGPAAMAVPSKLAEDWFPPSERTLATAVAALGNQSGTLILSLAIAAVWPNPTKHDNLCLNIFLAALSLLNVAAALVYFPSHPPVPPSASASISKEGEAGITVASLGRSVGVVFCNRSFVVVLLAYSASTGLLNCVNALLPQALGNLGEQNPQGTAGWVGFITNFSSMLCGIVLASIIDRYKGVFSGVQKYVLVVCMAMCGISFLAFATILSGALPALPSSTALYVVSGLYILSGTGQGVAIPIMFEICAEQTGVSISAGEGAEENELDEVARERGPSQLLLQTPSQTALTREPVPTGTMLSVLTVMSNLVSFVTLWAPNGSFFLWANWAGAGVFLASSIFFACFLPATLPRFYFDKLYENQLQAPRKTDNLSYY